MSSQAIKALAKIQAKVERIERQEMRCLLEYLGFAFRMSGGSHHKYTHAATGTSVVFSYRKDTDPIWGYEMTKLRKAVLQVLSKAQLANSIPIVDNREEGTAMPAELIKLPDHFVPKKKQPMQLTCLSVNYFPEAVAELVMGYENREITVQELIQELNDAGYRTTSGKPFTSQNYYSYLVGSAGYKKWKQEREMQHIKPVEHKNYSAIPETLPVKIPEAPAPAPAPAKLSAHDVLSSLTEILQENTKLKAENEALKAKLANVLAILSD